MIRAYSAAAVRDAEQPLLAAGKGPELMRRAAWGLARVLVREIRTRTGRVYGGRALLLVGAGNNGADTLFAGVLAAKKGLAVAAWIASAQVHGEALAAFEHAGGRLISHEPQLLEVAKSSNAIVDGLLGIGARGALREPTSALIAQLCQIVGECRARAASPASCPVVIACDLPSGIDPTTGEVPGTVLPADVTVTFGAVKTGLLADPAHGLCGDIELIDIGLAMSQAPRGQAVLRLEASEIGRLLPTPGNNDQKYTRGVAGIVAGSARYPGAALLATAAATACGPGMVRYLGPSEVSAAVHLRNPEIVCADADVASSHVQAWLVGPGIDGDAEQESRAKQALLSSEHPVVVDAGALALFTPSSISTSPRLLTPHAGELASLLQRLDPEHQWSRAQIEAQPLTSVRAAAKMCKATVLLKGPTTLISTPQGTVFSQSDGNARLATAGSGDTLAGILVSLIAQGCGDGAAATIGLEAEGDSTEQAHVALAVVAAMGAALHGRLSQIAVKQPLNAGMLASRIGAAWASFS